MKKTFSFLSILFAISLTAVAQPDVAGIPANDPPKIVKLKRAFVTQQLSLSNDEAKKFWPVYTSYTTELRQTRQAGRRDDVLLLEENMLNVRKKYKAEFKKILGTDDRVNKALTVDRDFLQVVRKEYMQRRGAKRSGPSVEQER